MPRALYITVVTVVVANHHGGSGISVTVTRLYIVVFHIAISYDITYQVAVV